MGVQRKSLPSGWVYSDPIKGPYYGLSWTYSLTQVAWGDENDRNALGFSNKDFRTVLAVGNYVVVGASRGIGLTLAQLLVAEGHHVHAFARNSGEIESSQNVSFNTYDVLDHNFASQELPSELDGFAYCPGSIDLGPLRSMTAERMSEAFNLNVLGAMDCFSACMSALRRGGGSAVFFSTVAVQRGMAMHTSVAAAKGALEALARTWAAELSPQVRVNCIAPALTDTQLAAQLLTNDARRAAMDAMYPLKRIGQPADIAQVAAFLLSPKSAWMTGQVVGVDGGLSTLYKVDG